MESKFRNGFVKNLVFYTMMNLAVVAIKDIYVILDICFRLALFLSEFEIFYENLDTLEI